jgi:hypothetical protein
MSEKPISPLRRRLLDDMNMRRFVPDTQREYIGAVKRLGVEGLVMPASKNLHNSGNGQSCSITSSARAGGASTDGTDDFDNTKHDGPSKRRAIRVDPTLATHRASAPCPRDASKQTNSLSRNRL